MEYAIRAPKLGEATQNLTLIKYLKKVGDFVTQDEPILVLETEKASMDMESPVSGTITKFLYEEGAIVPVGETLVTLALGEHKAVKPVLIESKAYIPINDSSALTSLILNTRNSILSPREKSYCLSNKVIPLQLYKQSFLPLKTAAYDAQTINCPYIDIPIGQSQDRLIQAFSESAKHVVPANVQILCDNIPIENYRRHLRKINPPSLIPSRLEIITWAIIEALKEHPNFASRIINTTTIRQFKNPNIGIAVTMEEDALSTAIINSVFSYSFLSFINSFRESIIEARKEDHLVTYHCLTISDLSTEGIINAIPVVTHPATATLFIGKPYLKENGKNLFYLSLSFDHRIINGAGAAAFLRSVDKTLRAVNRADASVFSIAS